MHRMGHASMRARHRMGHASMRAALIHQHATSERDREVAAGMDRRIKEATNKRKKGRRRKRPEDGPASATGP